jgi:hypothetical protein
MARPLIEKRRAWGWGILSEKQILARLGTPYEMQEIERRSGGGGGLSRDEKAKRARMARKNKKKQRRR